MPERSVKDRRSHPRVNAELSAKVTADGQGFEAAVKNVSVSGLLLEVDRAVPEMTMLRLRLSIPPDAGRGVTFTFEISGAVVRCEQVGQGDAPRYELAVFLTNMPREAKVALSEFISARLA